MSDENFVVIDFNQLNSTQQKQLVDLYESFNLPPQKHTVISSNDPLRQEILEDIEHIRKGGNSLNELKHIIKDLKANLKTKETRLSMLGKSTEQLSSQRIELYDFIQNLSHKLDLENNNNSTTTVETNDLKNLVELINKLPSNSFKDFVSKVWNDALSAYARLRGCPILEDELHIVKEKYIRDLEN